MWTLVVKSRFRSNNLDYRFQYNALVGNGFVLGTASKPNRRLTVGSARFRPVSIVLNNDNRPEPDGTPGQPAVGFEVAP